MIIRTRLRRIAPCSRCAHERSVERGGWIIRLVRHSIAFGVRPLPCSECDALDTRIRFHRFKREDRP